jgi:glycolate oxidase subunit GlcD
VTPSLNGLADELIGILGAQNVDPPDRVPPQYAQDATATRGVGGRPDLVVRPGTAEEVADTLALCYRHAVPLIPRGGGTGLAGGAVATTGGVVCSLERLTGVREFTPALWRMHVEAGVTTGHVRRLARENGLLFPPDPGAAEQSQIGGNVATNAGGPHAFKYGTTGAWVTGLEVAVAPGHLITIGGPVRKDVAGYDLRSLFVGSEGTLGIITSVWLRLIPAPERIVPVVAFFGSAHEGCEASAAVMGNGLQPAALDYLDGGTLDVAAGAYPGEVPEGARFALIAELDGSASDVAHQQAEFVELLTGDALRIDTPTPETVWRWRDGVSSAVTTRRGGKVSEDIVVPLDRLQEAVDRVIEIGASHGLEACSWGHAGDGNLHGTFMIDPDDRSQLDAAETAANDLFALAIELGGSISGEHGIGYVKRGQLENQWDPEAIALHEAIKQSFDPEGLLNPGKKVARVNDAAAGARAYGAGSRQLR